MLHHRRTGSDGTPAADIDIISDTGTNADMGALPHRYCSAQGGIGRDMDIISQHIIMLHDCSGVDDTVAASSMESGNDNPMSRLVHSDIR